MKRIMGLILVLPALAFLIACTSSVGEIASYDLRPGDLLFVVSGEENGITDVTSGRYGLEIDHVAIAVEADSLEGTGAYSKISVIEATVGSGVSVSPLDSFIVRTARLRTDSSIFASGSKASGIGRRILVGRVKGRLDVPESTSRAKSFIGTPYDDLFLPSEEAIYCSELVQKSLIFKNGKPVFETVPMSFHDSTGRVTPFWTKFYEERGVCVPEGERGTNPAAMSRDRNIRILGYLKIT